MTSLDSPFQPVMGGQHEEDGWRLEGDGWKPSSSSSLNSKLMANKTEPCKGGEKIRLGKHLSHSFSSRRFKMASAYRGPCLMWTFLSLLVVFVWMEPVQGWLHPSLPCTTTKKTVVSPLFAVESKNTKGKGYKPKWVKKESIADQVGDAGSLGFENVGLKGTIPVVFRQGNETRTSMAWQGQPLRDVATQAGQFIKYGCGKGECGTCECLVNGQWIRPCTATVPALVPGEEMVVQVKQVKAKSKSSGTFFSIKSFFMGFWNNLLGMIGFVKFRKAAKRNWEERQEYEDLIRQKTLEKKRRRAANGGGDPAHA